MTRMAMHSALNGDVHAWQQTTAGANEIFTSDITFKPQQNLAATPSPVKLVYPQGITTATGMEADFDAETYRLLADVESRYHGH